jgi:electron transport complex protein RnfE
MTGITVLTGGLAQPFGGFIFLGLMCGVYRWIRSAFVQTRSEADVSDK